MDLVLPEHCFYVDNIFVYEPLPHVRTMRYFDVDMYRYFIGREDQSVNETVMMGAHRSAASRHAHDDRRCRRHGD